MNIIYFLVPLALLLGISFLIAFIAASKSGQFDDLKTPAHRLLIEEELKTDPIIETHPSKTKT